MWSALMGAAAAQPIARGYQADPTTPSERGSEWYYLDSLDLRGHGRMAIGVVTAYARGLLVARDAGGSEVGVVRERAVLHAGAAFVFGERTRLSFDAPLQFVANGRAAVVRETTLRPPKDAVTPGDVRLGADVRLFGRYGEGATAAIGAQLFVPAGDPGSYSGDGEPRLRPRVSFAYNRRVLAVAAMLGAHLRGRNEAWGDGHVGSEAFAGLAIGARVAHGFAIVGPEILLSTVAVEPFRTNTTSLEAVLGTRVELAPRVRVGLGAGTSLVQGYGSPTLLGLASVEWVPDTPPPPEPEPSDLPPDRDGDGVPDADDACGFVPGEKSAFPERNGCPPPEPEPSESEMETAPSETTPSETETTPSNAEVKPSETEVKPSETEGTPSKTPEVRP